MVFAIKDLPDEMKVRLPLPARIGRGMVLGDEAWLLLRAGTYRGEAAGRPEAAERAWRRAVDILAEFGHAAAAEIRAN